MTDCHHCLETNCKASILQVYWNFKNQLGILFTGEQESINLLLHMTHQIPEASHAGINFSPGQVMELGSERREGAQASKPHPAKSRSWTEVFWALWRSLSFRLLLQGKETLSMNSSKACVSKKTKKNIWRKPFVNIRDSKLKVFFSGWFLIPTRNLKSFQQNWWGCSFFSQNTAQNPAPGKPCWQAFLAVPLY